MRRRTPRAERPLDGAALELLREVLSRGGQVELLASGLSMFPAIVPGDRLVLGPLGASDPRPGEIVAWVRGSAIRVHRVVRVEERAVVTRGDTVPVNDSPVERQEILGRLVQVRRSLWRRLRLRLRWKDPL
jgi:signal peptidase I